VLLNNEADRTLSHSPFGMFKHMLLNIYKSLLASAKGMNIKPVL